MKIENKLYNYVLSYDDGSSFGLIGISGKNYADMNNIPSFQTTKKRNLKKAWDYIVKNYKKMSFNQIIKYLDDQKLGVHYYCSVD